MNRHVWRNKVLANQKLTNVANQLFNTNANNNISRISYTLGTKKISKEHEQKRIGSGGEQAQGKGRAIQV